MDRPSAGRPWRYTEWRRAGSPSGQPRARRGGPRSRAPDPHQESWMIRGPLALALAVAALGSPAVAAAADSPYAADTGTSTPAGYGSAPGRPTGGSSPSGSACTGTVTGRLYVRDPTLDGIAGGDPLPGVAIKVSGADSF